MSVFATLINRGFFSTSYKEIVASGDFDVLLKNLPGQLKNINDAAIQHKLFVQKLGLYIDQTVWTVKLISKLALGAAAITAVYYGYKKVNYWYNRLVFEVVTSDDKPGLEDS